MDEFNNEFNTNQNDNTIPENVTNNQENVSGEYHFVPPIQNESAPVSQSQTPEQPPVQPKAPQQVPTQQQVPVQPQQQRPQQSYYYTPPKGADNQYYMPNNQQNSPFNPQPTPPKKPKNKALIVTIVIVCVCIVVAVAALALSSSGLLKGNSSSSTTSSSEDAQAQVQSSDSAALTDGNGDYTVAGVASENIDSCVLISVYTDQSSYSSFYGYGFGSNNGSSSGSSSTLSGEGSGVIMSEADGKTYIMTCAHVISDGSSFKVTTNDGTVYDATMVGSDSQTDIGVLVIDATGLKVATFADSDDIVVGEQCVAIGCPGGSKFMNSVATGIVSAVDRPVSSSIGYDNECIQTDTAINPGNSGGALFNMQGQVIGINSSKIASTEYEGMGFAVPSNTAVDTANSIIKNGYVAGRAKIGITYASISNVSNSSAILSALEEKGYKDAEGTLIINQVNSDSDLADEDVKQYDMIVAIDGETLTSTDVLTSKLSECSPGDTVTLTIARIENNQISTFDVKCKLIESKD